MKHVYYRNCGCGDDEFMDCDEECEECGEHPQKFAPPIPPSSLLSSAGGPLPPTVFAGPVRSTPQNKSSPGSLSTVRTGTKIGIALPLYRKHE